MNKTKLCYILPDYNPDTGSHFYHLYELLEGVSEKLDIFVIIEKSADHVDPQKLPFEFYVQRFSFPAFRYLELAVIIFIARLKGVRNFYTHYSYYGGLITRLVTLVLGGKAYYWNCGMPWDYKRGIFKETIFRYILKNTILVTGTELMRQKYIKNYNLKEKNTRVFPNWINLKRFKGDFGSRDRAREKLGLPKDKKIILFVHHLSKRKGVQFLPEIIKELESENILLIVVGDGPEREALDLRFKNYDLREIVRFEGSQPNQKIPLYFWASDVFLMPSKEEGFPRVILEAMATARPFVASDVGGMKDIIPQEAEEFLCKAGDINCFVDNLKQLLTNEQLYDEFQLAEIDFVSQYDLPVAIDKFARLFSQ